MLEAGAGGWSSHWGSVPERLADRMRVIAYDRGGLGWSDPARGSRSVPVLVREKLALLDALGVIEPAIFVAHSFGASIARLAARQAPERCAGIVFVDGWHESFDAWERAQGLPGPPTWLLAAHLVLAKSGLMRVLGALTTPSTPAWPIEPEVWRAITTISATGNHVHAAWREFRAFGAGDHAVKAVDRLAASVPVRVLIARHTLSPDDAPKRYAVRAHNEAWRTASGRLASLSERATISIVDGTDHMIPLHRPEAVIAAIDELRATDE